MCRICHILCLKSYLECKKTQFHKKKLLKVIVIKKLLYICNVLIHPLIINFKLIGLK